MKPPERQDQIIAQLLEHGSVHIMELCERFQVSEGTIRNDLRTLEAQGRLIRTQGGAVPADVAHPVLARRSRVPNSISDDDPRRTAQIHSIAKRAAELVNEGDLIVMCGSPITRALAVEIVGMKSLVVLTNSLDIAQKLAHNPAHTVILIGGQVRTGRDTLDGPIAAGVLERMRVNKAFVTCDGVNTAQGFASNDIADAQIKAGMVACADHVIVLAMEDSIGKLGLMSFAGLNQAQQLITTNGAPADVVNALVAAGVRVSLCGERITEVWADSSPERTWRIGFANLNEQQDFAVAVRESIERAAAATGKIELILADNESDSDVAVENARRMLQAKVDLVIEYQQDERTNYALMDMFRSAGVPVIAIDIPMPGAVYFGADNYRAGRIAGEAATTWIREHWNGQLDKVVCLEQSESGAIPAARIQGALATLRGQFPLKENDILHFETRGMLDESRSAATQALRNIPWGRRVLFIGINANSAIGALEAAEVLGRQHTTAVVSQNVSKAIRRELRRNNPMLIGGVDYFPNTYGERVIPLALQMLAGSSVPPAVYTDHILVTAENVHRLYPEDANGAFVPELSARRTPDSISSGAREQRIAALRAPQFP
ncbi:MAG: substrate-binding domain-containing protein [Anaerolineae bacterium]|nr:substrate-binding domain-containing protein [Anaerolineae bacterium]